MSILLISTSDKANDEWRSSDIIVLNKENMNPEVFRGSEKDKTNSGADAGSSAGAENRGLGGSSNANSTAGRKRTLSDFMEEKEKEKTKTKTKAKAKAKAKAKHKAQNRAGTGSSGVLSLSLSPSVHAHVCNQSSGSAWGENEETICSPHLGVQQILHDQVEGQSA